MKSDPRIERDERSGLPVSRESVYERGLRVIGERARRKRERAKLAGYKPNLSMLELRGINALVGDEIKADNERRGYY